MSTPNDPECECCGTSAGGSAGCSGEGVRERGRACRGPCGAGRGGARPELGEGVLVWVLGAGEGREERTGRWVGMGGRLENEGVGEGDGDRDGPALPPT
jgi:hypothetical protein